MSKDLTFDPDYCVSPEELIQEYMHERKIGKTELASRCRVPGNLIERILQGKVTITSKTARKIAEVLDVSAVIIINAQNLHNRYLMREDND